MRIVLPGQTPAQKNNKQIVGIRPVSKGLWRGTPTIVDSKITKTWRDATAKLLSDAHTAVLTGQIVAHYTFYVKDKRGRDIDNMVVSCNDALVKGGVIPGDTWQKLRIAGAIAVIDRENPRAEIELNESQWSIDDEE